eukprot:Trichotokara_eunicae@DN3435_c0_g1_i1.p1
MTSAIPAAKKDDNVIPIHSLTLPELKEVHQTLEEEVLKMRGHLSTLKMALERFKLSKKALGALEIEEFNDGETPGLMPLTASLYVPFKSLKRDKVFIDIGTGFIIEQTKEQAAVHFSQKIEFVWKKVSETIEAIQEKQKFTEQTSALILIRSNKQK